MDPITVVVGALAAGALAGLKPTAEAAVKDAYEGLKALIRQRYATVDVTPVENRPDSEDRRQLVAGELDEVGAGEDEELLDRAKALLELIQRYAPDVPEVVGVIITDMRGANVRIRGVRSRGGGVIVDGVDLEGDLDVQDVVAGEPGDAPNPPARRRASAESPASPT
jgi:hypothetical protein